MHFPSLRGALLAPLALIFASFFSASAAPRQWTDTSGMFRVEAELIAVRNGRVVLEKPDGSVITVPLEKLSAADHDYLKSLDRPAQKTEPATSPSPAADKSSSPASSSPFAASSLPVVASSNSDPVALANQVKTVLEKNCYRCHGQDGASEGGFNFALNLEKLARTLVKPKNPGGSLLYERMSSSGDSVMPPEGESPRPKPSEIALIKQWIEAGAPVPAMEKARPFISNDDVVKHVLADVRSATDRSRKYLRYFTLSHLYNSGVSEDELQTYRNAFIKLINSLSWNNTLLIPAAIDPARTIFRIDIRQLNWTSEIWELLAAANPYYLPLSTPDALACNEATETRIPYVRIDWFVFAASKPPLYHVVLGVPPTDQQMEVLLRVNVAASIKQEQAIRAAFNRSGVSQHNRLIEWHKSSYGSYWKSYDFGGSSGRQNLFEHPLGPGNDEDNFRHDGGELIFTLPNGLQGYMLVDGAGRRIDHGPVSIVSDPKQPDRTVTNGVSCMSCHYAGVIPKSDEVGPAVRANPKAFSNSGDILALYREPKELDDVLDDDAKRFAAALKKIGINIISRSGEPISAMAQRFQQEVDLPMAACEFGLTPAEFEKRLESAETITRTFAPLRLSGGTIKREVLFTAFSRAAKELKLVAEEPNAAATAKLPAGLGATVAAVTSINENTRATAPPPAKALVPKSSSGSAKSSSGAVATNVPKSAPTKEPVLKSIPGETAKPGEVRRFKDLGWGVKSLAFSPNGGFLAAGKMDQAILLFDVADNAQIQSIQKLEMLKQVTCVAFTPGGNQLLAAGYSGHIQIYNVSKEGMMKESGQFPGHSQEVNCLAFSGDGRFAVSGGREKKLRYWQVEDGQEQAVFTGFDGPIKACYIAKNGRTAMATDGATLLFIDLMKRDVTKKRQLARSWTGQAACFSTDGDQVAVSDGKDIRLWNLNSVGEKPKMEESDMIWSMSFTPDGTRLITGTRGQINVWDVGKERKIHSLPTAGSSYVQSLAVSPDNRHVAAIPSSAGQDLQIFRVPTVSK
jgi:mono/diheme cytochrome c family protein